MSPPLLTQPPRPAVRLTNVTKTFGAHTAVRQLSLSVPTGCTYGFIGPNGSGKTTTIRTILHIFHPDSGEVEVLGERSTRAANDRIGYLPEERGLYKKMTVHRVLAYYAALKGMKRADAAAEIQKWLAKMGLSEWADKKVEALSKGMAQKIQFIAAVIARPELLILDEPFSGLDPVNLEVIRAAILELRAAGTTVIFSTHDMAMAETMCDFIFMIYRGNKVLDGTLADIQRSYGEDTVRVNCTGGADLLRNLPGVELVRDLGQSQELRHPDPQALLRELAARTTVRHFEVCQPSLHDIFIRIAKPDSQEMQVPKTTGGGS
ncbi:MAG: ATP-binding cassette domain-containing protein [Proteobacteria bacterium]|nr:ATP-binding cassette domain-containing protein [Verrucomicrobiota bacterium]NBU08361.1 ATP-binding cassette domain-containing protein [Pseudomonadota bacterium]